MCRVGALSMQRIRNYGSFLQAYGLMNMLKGIGRSVEFVDYQPGECLLPAPGCGAYAKVKETLTLHAPWTDKLRYIRYKRRFPRYYTPLGMTERRNYSTDYDLLIIGSDEVFNCCQNNPNVGFSPALFGAGHQAKRLISYAASFGNTTLEDLRRYGVSERVAEWLDGFDALSVRDENSGRIVEALTGKKPLYHLDPVLVSDIGETTSTDPLPIGKAPYLILYGYSGRFSREECEAVAAYARRKRLKIYCMGGLQRCCDRFIDCPPLRVADYFRGADCVVTDTFHGVILSVIARRPFAAFVRESGYGNAQKVTDLLSRLDLQTHQADSIRELSEILRIPIGSERIRYALSRERERSLSYLQAQIQLIPQ